MVDSKWLVNNDTKTYRMISPDFYIDGIYKSMEGPKSSNYVQLSQDSAVLWITGFKVKALNSKTGKRISNDFICHTNVDFNDVKYYSNFHLENRIGKQYPRMTSLSHGLENFKFPKGFGIPMKGNDLLYVTTQSLNHNLPDANYLIKHEVTIEYSNESSAIKPLMSKTVFVQLPYDKVDPYKSPLDPGKDFCIPVETKNHSYEDGKGNVLSGHWVIPVGKNTYRSSIDNQIQIKDSLRLHAAAIHVHPFATAITLFDNTTKTAIFTSHIINHKGKIGLASIEVFNSETGIWLYQNHQYELVLDVNNTSKGSQDMMGSMFLFFYDQELDQKIQKGL
ncbi:hypothetical protein EKL32_24670 [Flavobacterium sp. GSN2]|nr:hypothetical protein EKL32_24670 [Flavobacterium sp. GSN2]